ncbi:hypothetical protein A9Q78_00210 [Methylophaga sp. 41_12_T18]|nr:hypothetical protein A9Q78_00210 [Methylophaga sp. 41_12_T18]
MSDSHYEKTITTVASAECVYKVITQEMSYWWTPMSDNITKLGDRTIAKFEDGTTWSFEVITLDENKLITMRCYEANHIHPVTSPEMRTEWENTLLKFEITNTHKGTSIHFSHIGLTPTLNCYDICCSGWDHFFATGLKGYLNTIN